MLYQNKYIKYVSKYKQLGNATTSYILPSIVIKGPMYMCHLNYKNKNIYLFGETHKKISDITCGDEKSLRMIDWLQTNVIPKYIGGNILDIFIELPLKLNWDDAESEEKLEENRKLKLSMDNTLVNLVTLTQKTPENTRIHTVDTRNELSQILGKIRMLDINIRNFMKSPRYIEYISQNHIMLLECLDIVINLHTIQYFNIDDKIINIDEVSVIINDKLTKYMIGIEEIVTSESFYDANKDAIDNDISVFKYMIKEILLDINYVPKTDFNFPPEEYIPGILHDHLLNKIMIKIDDEYKSFFIDLNQKLFTLKRLFHEKYDTFKTSFIEKLQIPDRNLNLLSDEFYNSLIFPDFNNISEIADLYISFMALFMDLYIIGRLLKPYIKSCIIYTGLRHTQNINKQLILYGFNLIYETSPIDEIKEEDKYDDSKDCVNITDLNLITS
jgi:hypothetical protein